MTSGRIQAVENSSLLYKKAADMAFAGDVAGAIPLFQRVTVLSPSFVLGHYGLGKAYLCVDGRLDDAVTELKKAVACDRSFAKAHFYLGMAYMFRRDYAWSVDAFLLAYKTDRTFIEALYNIGAIFDFMGHPFKSRKYFNDYAAAKSGENEPF
jgi:tetratricopeptide (TPR) repeat protein